MKGFNLLTNEKFEYTGYYIPQYIKQRFKKKKKKLSALYFKRSRYCSELKS